MDSFRSYNIKYDVISMSFYYGLTPDKDVVFNLFQRNCKRSMELKPNTGFIRTPPGILLCINVVSVITIW